MWLTNVITFLIFSISFCYGHTYTLQPNGPPSNSENTPDISISAYSKISEKCLKHIKEYEIGIFKREMWALEMLDASAKAPSSGILNGNLVYLGDFDMCLNANNSRKFFGKYCLGALPFPKANAKNLQSPETRMITPDGSVSGMMAVCLPDSCSAKDFQEYQNNQLIKLNFYENLCTSKSSKPELDGGDIATISILAIVFYIILMSTAYEAIIFYMKKKPVHPVLTAFSLVTNTKKLLQTSNAPGQISCLHGMRVISMMWVVLGHRYVISSAMPSVNIVSFSEWYLDIQNMIVMGATVSVDTFFLLAGLLVSYAFLLATSKGFKFNIFIYYLHRFLRLTPLLAVLILIHATVLKHLGSGPLWNNTITPLSTACKTHWWSTLLYIQNYVNPTSMCIPQTWYLSADTQLFLLSPLILLPLKQWPKIGLTVAGIFTLFSIIASFVIAWVDELSGFIVANMKDATALDYMKHYYLQPYTRAAPWIMGVVLGYIIFEVKQKQKKISINTFVSLFLWLISLTILSVCVFTGQNMLKDTYTYNRFANAVYVALMRPGWALGVSWIIFACITGYGGAVNWFLSLPVFQVMSKLTYSMYLIHMTMLYIISGQTRMSLHFSNLELMYQFWGDFAFTFGASVIFTLAFESPILIIEKIIFGKKETPPQLTNQRREPEEHIQKIEIS